MRNLKCLATQSAIAILLIGGTLTAAPVNAQSADVVETAKQSCTEKAQADGFTLQSVTEAGPSDRPGKDAKVVLDLTKDGASARLTCYYSQAEGVVFGEDGGTGGTGVVGPIDRNVLWWLLLPLIGLPLLLWWAGRRGGETYAAAAATGTRTEAVVHSHGNSVTIHSGPGSEYRATGTLHDQQRVILSDRYQNNWAELADGGWVHTDQLNINPAYAR